MPPWWILCGNLILPMAIDYVYFYSIEFAKRIIRYLENVHTLLRMVLPKGTSFEFLTQWDVNLIVNHINSTPRKSLNGSTPYDVSAEAYGEEVLKKLQLRRIDPDEVKLSPKLIRNN